MRRQKAAIGGKRLAEMGLRLFLRATALCHHAEAVMGGGKARTQRHGLLEILPRALELVARKEEDAKVEMRLRVPRVHCDRQAIAALGHIKAPRLVVRHAVRKHVARWRHPKAPRQRFAASDAWPYSHAWARFEMPAARAPGRLIDAGDRRETVSSFWLPSTWCFETKSSIQREHEQVARVLQPVVLHRMQVAAAGLHGEILLGPDRVGDGRALERSADVEAPELLQRLVVVSDHPAVLQRGEHHTAGGDQRTRADLDVGDRLGHDLVVDGVEGGDRSVVEIAGVGALLALLVVEAAIG